MDELFRFMTIRPAERPKNDRSVSIAAASPFQGDLQQRRGSENPVAAMVAEAKELIGSEDFVGDPAQLADGERFRELDASLSNPSAVEEPRPKEKEDDDDRPKENKPGRARAAAPGVARTIERIFGKKPSDLMANAAFREEIRRLFDSIIALFLVPRTEGASLEDLVRTARLVDIIRRAAAGDPTLDAPGAIAEAMQRTLLLPDTIFPVISDQIRPAGVGDVLVVKQHLKRYELGEVEHFENVLMGETRKHTAKHALTTDRTVMTDTETTTETSEELTVAERFELKRETENVLKQDTSVKAGLAASYKYGTVLEVKTNVDVAYSESKSESNKVAASFAKDVTTRAAKKVTERARTQVTVRTTETYETNDEHGFDNTKQGSANVVGVYQWVNKVYEAKVFKQKGQRLLFDLTVPEPAAFLHDAVDNRAASATPKAPDEFTLSPAELSMDLNHGNYYGKLAAKYHATVSEPPADHIVVAKTLQGLNEGDESKKNIGGAGEVLDIPPGYMAKRIDVNGMYNSHTDNHQINVFVGPYSFECKNKVWGGNAKDNLDASVAELVKIPVGLTSSRVSDFAVTIEVNCVRTKTEEEKWRLKTHAAILQGYVKQHNDYLDELAQRKFETDSRGTLGGNPDLNRRIEQTELKKACLGVLTERVRSLLGFNAIAEDAVPEPKPGEPPAKRYPRPAAAGTVIDQGSWIRFFEQAFEWEHMVYVFYPYFWGRKPTWYDRALETHNDPTFAEFLRAGEARVVVPVREHFDRDVLYFLMTGQIWGGGGLPSIGDKTYVHIVDEIKANTGGADDWDPEWDKKPEAAPWEITVPTSLIKLRKDGALPGWERKDPTKWEWTPKPADS
jgi:hypothetical protein